MNDPLDSDLIVSGDYFAHIEVLIQNQYGKTLVDRGSNGPCVFADLPEGHYRITAIHAGVKKARKIAAGEGFKTVWFHWKLQMSLTALIFYASFFGAAIVAVLALPKLAMKHLKIRSLKREIYELKKKVVDLEKENAGGFEAK